MKQQKKNGEKIGDQSFFLSHELRRPLANLVAIFELIKNEQANGKNQSSSAVLLKQALADFDKVIIKYNKTLGR